MSTDIHHNDDPYRKAYQRLEEEPSPEVWSKVMADLDNRDAKYYQKKSLRWKRTSLLLLLLLGTVIISGILYISNNQSNVVITSSKNSSEKETAGKTISIQSLSDDSSTTTQNIYKNRSYAAQPTDNHSDTNSSTIPQTAPEQLDNLPDQDDAGIRKQTPEQVQDTSVNNSSFAIRQQAIVKDNAPLRNKEQQPAPAKNFAALPNKGSQQTLAKKNHALTGNEEVNTNPPNMSLYKRSTASHYIALKRQSAFGRSSRNEEVYQSGTNTNEKAAFTLLPVSGVRTFTNNIATKETIDSNVADQINAMAAFNQKKSIEPDATAAINKKAVKIAKLFKPRLQVTGYSSFDMTQYHLDNDEHGSNNGQSHRGNKHEIEERESHGFSFSAGLVARLQATRKLSLKTGLSYSSTSINIQSQTLYADRDDNQHIAYKFITSSGYGYVKPSAGAPLLIGDSTKAANGHHQLQYLSIPVMFGYTAYTSKHVTIIPSIGAAANMLLSANVKSEINIATAKEPVSITKLDGLKPWYPSLMADVELQYQVKRNWSIMLLPSLRYAISPITQNNAVKTVPYSLGLGLGFTYHL